MFLLDTNVVPELLPPSPDAVVETSVGDLQATDPYVSKIGEAELRYGVAILPAGRRQTAILPPDSLDSRSAILPGSGREKAPDISEYGRAGFDEEPLAPDRSGMGHSAVFRPIEVDVERPKHRECVLALHSELLAYIG